MVVLKNNLLGEFSSWLALSDRKSSTVNALCRQLRLLRLNCPGLSKNEIESFLSFLKSKNTSTSHINNLISVSKVYYHFCTEKGYPVDDFTSLKFVKDKYRPRATMSDEEIEAFLKLEPVGNQSKHAFKYWTVFFSIMAYTGMRTGEVAKLRIENVDFSQGIFYLLDTKTNENRLVPIPVNIKDLVYEWVNSCKGYLFPSKRPNGHTSNVEWHYNFHTRIKRLGINRPNLTPYSLRHSYITEMLQTEGVNIFDVKNLVGHHDTRTTENYYHLTTKRLKKVSSKHPGVRKHTTTKEIFNLIEEFIDNLGLGKEYSVEKKVSDLSLNFNIERKEE